MVTFYGDPGEIRTPDPRLRRPLLYPTELLDHIQLWAISLFRKNHRILLYTSPCKKSNSLCKVLYIVCMSFTLCSALL